MSAHLSCIDIAPFQLSGVVVGALLNDAAELGALGDAVHQAPYKAPPQAPVLEVKPRHTLAGDGASVVVPHGVEALQIGASLGIVMGRVACRVPQTDAMNFVAGYLIGGDLSLPIDSHYRPSARLKARDGFCPMSGQVVPAAALANPDAVAFEVLVDGIVVQRGTSGGRTRGVAKLIADVTEFMSLQAGDVLLLGRARELVQAGPGQSVTIAMAGLGQLDFRLVAEETPS